MRMSVMKLFACMWLSVVLAACGGGGGGDKNCSDFAYQEDAQAWHNSHSNSDLDSDHDGIACESLPRRPGGSSGGGSSSNMTLPSVMVFDLSGQVSAIQKQTSYYVRSSVSIDGSGGAGLTGVQIGDGRFALDSISGREFMLDYGGPGGYPARYMPTGDTAYAWPMDTVPSGLTAGMGGTYTYMGKRCVSQVCAPGMGQFSLDVSSLTLTVCESGTVAACSAGLQTYVINPYGAQSSTPGVYRFNSNDGLRSGFVAFGSRDQGAIGLAFQTQGATLARVSAFAARTSWTYRPTTSTAIFHSIVSGGFSNSKNSETLVQGAIMDSPMSGFFTIAGNGSALNMVMSWPARVLSFDGATYTLWLN